MLTAVLGHRSATRRPISVGTCAYHTAHVSIYAACANARCSRTREDTKTPANRARMAQPFACVPAGHGIFQLCRLCAGLLHACSTTMSEPPCAGLPPGPAAAWQGACARIARAAGGAEGSWAPVAVGRQAVARPRRLTVERVMRGDVPCGGGPLGVASVVRRRRRRRRRAALPRFLLPIFKKFQKNLIPLFSDSTIGDEFLEVKID